jgi:hypothetical protein
MMTRSNEITTMICATQTDAREEWAAIASAFIAALDALCSRYEAVQDGVAKSWGQAEKDVSAAGLAVATFISNKHGIVWAKRAMATSLREWSLKQNEQWAGGLADLIDSSNREMPAHLHANDAALYPVPHHIPSWPPAREFWKCVKHSEATMGEAAVTVLNAVPMTEEELCHKVLIAAFTGGLALVVKTTSVGPQVDPAAAAIRTWMRRLMAVTDLVCLAAILDPRSYNEIVHAARTHPFNSDLSDAEIVRVMLGVAHDRWHRSIWLDAKRLGLRLCAPRERQHKHR